MMTREEYLAKRREYYSKHKEQWREYERRNREKIRKDARRRRSENIEHYRDVARRWREDNKGKISEYGKRYHSSEKGQARYKKYYETHKEEFFERAYKSKAKYKDEVIARYKVANALKMGVLTKQPCELCGEKKADAHHDDYNKPLEVRWLCRRCHINWHKNHSPIRVSEKTWLADNGIEDL